METNVLQQLFQEPIEEIIALDPGYSGHASDVWSVRTASQEVVVRSSRLQDEPAREFWWGCKFIFGIDPREMIYFLENAKVLHAIPDIPAPTILSDRIIDGKEYLVVEKMKGNKLHSFTNQPAELLYQFGQWLAKVHMNAYNFYGNLAKTKTVQMEDYHHTLAEAMRRIAEREYPIHSKIRGSLERIIKELNEIPVPSYFCPVFIDLDPSQFLVDHGRISAVVDIEAYVVGPREMDFIALEYILDKKSSEPFISGYTTILQLPEISAHRRVYRYLYRLLGVQGSVDLDEWFSQPELFI
ncbi:aminoglycoside phosphotransferase family protein [Paenibacillus mendelii]|uniref:Aminoglycoside phosphotransferase family protein n=1 Tax=Paenibacillus mendelii TaxID=206163 RepID=A0ABV6JIH9_9BACL|nr:aminoglycoside phosphotransferase family protein [Paenibacillus mendelii]MCQ6557222.1 aminoglycoside phosphotransferase family protein [Paenibacillus mendelii]